MHDEISARVGELKKLCQARGWSVAVAESCTSGLLASWIGSQAGVSQFFLGGVISYAGSVKEQILKVPEATLKAFGEVSLPTAQAMAIGVRRELKADWAVSVTGIAGPSGGSPDKPVGFVCFAVAGPGVELNSQQQFKASGGREDIQRQAALFAFDFLLSAMR